jgi:hypothetical protein
MRAPQRALHVLWRQASVPLPCLHAEQREGELRTKGGFERMANLDKPIRTENPVEAIARQMRHRGAPLAHCETRAGTFAVFEWSRAKALELR